MWPENIVTLSRQYCRMPSSPALLGQKIAEHSRSLEGAVCVCVSVTKALTCSSKNTTTEESLSGSFLVASIYAALSLLAS